MQYNHAMLRYLFGPLGAKVENAARSIMERASPSVQGIERNFSIHVFEDGHTTVDLEPECSHNENGWDSIVVWFYATTWPDACNNDGAVQGRFSVIVPLRLLSELPQKYFVYHVSFYSSVSGGQICETTGDRDPLTMGYYGITKRNPFTRFKEHERDGISGSGHLLHKTWNGLLRRGVNLGVTFFIHRGCKDLDEAYETEERLVEKYTLAPKGLNAIPGGMAGIRMMHQLRLLSSTHQVMPADRDAALVRLETQHHDRNSPCAHYRTGHFRNLPSGKLTWVSPCWVNPPLG